MADPTQPAQRATLAELVNYQPEQYLTDAEVSLIRNTFKNNPNLLRAVRKVLLPSMDASELPIEEIGKDLWFQGIKWEQVPADEAKTLIVARQDTIKFIVGGLIQLKQIANSVDETPAQREMRKVKDSLK